MMSACTLEQVVSRFGRAHRYRLGAELREAVEDLKVLCRLGHDVEHWKPARRLPWPPGRQ